MVHLNIEAAFDMLEGRSDPQQRPFWTEHLTGCDDCRRELDRCRALRKDLKREHLKSASMDDITRALNLFSVTPAERPSLAPVFAIPLFDSFAQPAVAGARGTSEARHVVLRAEEFDIHVKIWGSPQHRHMMGQLLTRGASEFGQLARLHLVLNGVRVETTAVDETGEFRFDEISDGPLSLQIDLPHMTVIGPLDDPV